MTPGGHRRFPRNEIDALLRQRDGASGTVGDELIETILASTRSEIIRMDETRWMSAMTDVQKTHLREEGRHVMELLREFLHDDADRPEILNKVREAGVDYAESAAKADLSLTELLGAVSFFRSHILETAVDQRSASAEERRGIFRNVNLFLNTLLLSVAETFEKGR